jgi:transcriptional regulator with XRE-family HTH domain
MQYKRTQKEIEYCKYLSEVIKELRIKKGKSLNRLALDSLMTPSTLCRIENTP